MNARQKGPVPQAPPLITMRQVYNILFRHKWLIAILAGTGLVAAIIVHLCWHYTYTSQAEIEIRYIHSDPTSATDGTSRIYVDRQGSGIMNTELKILTSYRLIAQVASNLDVEAILGVASKSNEVDINRVKAAAVIQENLHAGVERDCDIITLQYTGRDAATPQQVLANLISAYKTEYAKIHLQAGISVNSLEEKADDAKNRYADSVKAFKSKLAELNITSLDDAKKNLNDMISKVSQDKLQTEVDLAQARQAVADLQGRTTAPASTTTVTNHATNDTPAKPVATPDADTLNRYNSLIATLTSRRNREAELLTRFTTNNTLVQTAQSQRAETEGQLKQMEQDFPGIATFASREAPRTASTVASGPDFNFALTDAIHRANGLTAKYQQLTNMLAQYEKQARDIANGEDGVAQARADMEVAEQKYKNLQIGFQQAEVNEANASKGANIYIVEDPTPSWRNAAASTKATGWTLGVFLALAFGIPFLIEMVIDQTIKSPLDIQLPSQMPFFITMPRTNGHPKPVRRLKTTKKRAMITAGSAGTPAPQPDPENKPLPAPTNGELAPWDARHELKPFFETLRDRLMTYFEMINLTHKPKLVAVTSCGRGAGVTTTAAGLASSLSEVGDGNVLLVNMNGKDGEAHHFYKGNLSCGLDEILEGGTRENALVQKHLYVAKEMPEDTRLPRVLPKRFSHLLPKMKASDFDYIIFDMPPVSQISITPRLARFMDMVLLVIESEKTDRDAAKSVASMLAETKTSVGIVLNKNRSYLPRRLQQEF